MNVHLFIYCCLFMYYTEMEITETQMNPGAQIYSLQMSDGFAPLQKAPVARSPERALLKRQRCNSPERLRCTRRLNFGPLGLGVSQQQQQPVAVARRNERERNRVKQVNMGFQTLRQHVPNGAANKKMSKVETLRSAVEYIRALQRLLDEHDAVSAAFRCAVPSPTVSSACSADPESPRSACSSDEGGYEHLNSEEQELLDFAAWFDGF